MMISKFFNRMKESTPVTNDPRVLTPNSIPVFILPPTLDKTASNTPRHELNDDCECWSIPDEEAKTRVNNNANNDSSSLKKTNNNLMGLNKQQSTSSSKLTTESHDINNNYNFSSRNFNQSSDKSHNKPKQNINITNSVGNSIYKPKIVISSIENINELTQTDLSMSSSQQSSRKSKPVIDINEDRRSSNGKNVFRNTVLNNMQSIIVNDNNNEKLTKEDYCKLWVLHGDSETNSVNNCAGVGNSISANQLTKVPSLNVELDENDNESKTEEQLQREYLVNLLMQLSNEEQQQQHKHNNSTDNDRENDSNLIKKSKRSKSETFLTQNSTLLNNPNISNMLTKHSNKFSNSNKKKTNNNLNIKNSNEALNQNGERRFSFLNIFSKQFQPVTTNLSQQLENTSRSQNGFLNVNENQTNFIDKQRAKSVFDFNNNNNNNHNNNNNINNKNNNLSPNRLNTSASTNKLLKKLTAVTAFKSQNNLNINDSYNHRGSIFGSIKSSCTLTQNNNNNSTNNNNNNNNSTHTFNIDINDEDDFDKIFNEYLKKHPNKRINMDSFQNTMDQNNNNINSNNLVLLTTSTKPNKNRKLKNIFKFIFKAKNKNNITMSESNNVCSVNEENYNSNNENEDYEEDYLMQTNQSSISNETSFFRYDLELIKMNNDFNLFSIDKELMKMKNNFKENEHFFIELKAILKHNFHGRDKHNSLSSKDKVSIKTNKSNSLNINQFNHVASASRQKSPRNSITTMASTTKTPLSRVLTNSKKNFLNVSIDVSFERLQQLIQGHLISINLKNLKVDPLIEINYVKSRLTYISIEQLDLDTFMASSASTQNITSLSNRNELSRLANNKQLAKITRLKTKKCKFDHNFKYLSKPADFFLKLDHFLNVTEEATNIKLKNAFNKKDSIDNFDSDFNNNVEMNNNTNDDINSMKGDQAFLFLFTIELHSYLPVSRKTLSSTFRKKKRIFRGQCQIHENFIKSTVFNKKFILHEI